MNRVDLTGLLLIELPDYTVRLCDGGFIVFGGQTFRSFDPLFGTVRSVEPLDEGAGDSVPALDLVMLPPEESSPAELSQPGFQQSRVRMWIGAYNPEAGTLLGTPELLFDGQIDQTRLIVGHGQRELTMSIVSTAERLFERNIGNSLNPTWHKSVWPGEEGHSNATGLGVPVAWGVENGSANGSTQRTNTADVVRDGFG